MATKRREEATNYRYELKRLGMIFIFLVESVERFGLHKMQELLHCQGVELHTRKMREKGDFLTYSTPHKLQIT